MVWPLLPDDGFSLCRLRQDNVGVRLAGRCQSCFLCCFYTVDTNLCFLTLKARVHDVVAGSRALRQCVDCWLSLV